MKKQLMSLLVAAGLLLGLPALAVPTDLTPTSTPSTNGSITANSADFTWTACDASNGNSCTHTGKELILAYNSNGSATAYTITVTSVADELGRTGDQTYSLGAGEYCVLGPYPVRGWRQSNGKLYFSSTNAELKFRVIRLPNI